MITSESLDELAPALVKAQATFDVPKKTKTAAVGKYSYKYSTLDALLAAIRKPLSENGLVVLQNVTTPDGGTVSVNTVILHASGQRIEFDAVTLQSGATPQTMGSAITYARRYSLSAALNIAAEDDTDGKVDAEHKDEESETDSHDTTTRVADVAEKSGVTSGGKAYTIYTITFTDGQKATTFDATKAKNARDAKEYRVAVTPEIVPGKKQGTFDLVGLGIPSVRRTAA